MGSPHRTELIGKKYRIQVIPQDVLLHFTGTIQEFNSEKGYFSFIDKYGKMFVFQISKLVKLEELK